MISPERKRQEYKHRRKRQEKWEGKSKSFDSSCRNHGSCDYCNNNRCYSSRRELEATQEELDELE